MNFYKRERRKMSSHHHKHHKTMGRHFHKKHKNNSTDKQYFDMETKKQLVDFIYKKLNISKFRYKILQMENDLKLLKDTKYYVSPNYNGINSLLVFVKLKDKYYSFTVDRRTLNYNHKNLDINRVRMVPIDMRLDKNIYNGTIMDGVILYNNPDKNRKNRKKVFVVNDIYYFAGANLTKDKMKNKIINLNAYLKCHYVKDDYMNTMEFLVNNLYDLKNIKLLVNVYIPKSRYKNSIKGIAFFPEISSTKLIYLFSNCSNIKSVSNSPQDTPSSSKNITIRKSKIIAPKESINAIFRMKQTGTVDVYTLYLAKKVKKNGKKFLKYLKFGIAYVQTTECSYFCKDLFNSKESDTVLVECKYLPDKKKWVPFKDANHKKIPDDFDEINKYFVDDTTEEEE